MRLYSHYKAGFLAFEGNLMEQPNTYLEAIELIGSTLDRIYIEKARG